MTEHRIQDEQRLLDQYIAAIPWSDSTPEAVRALVLGNLRGLAAHFATLLAHVRIENARLLQGADIDRQIIERKQEQIDKLCMRLNNAEDK